MCLLRRMIRAFPDGPGHPAMDGRPIIVMIAQEHIARATETHFDDQAIRAVDLPAPLVRQALQVAAPQAFLLLHELKL